MDYWQIALQLANIFVLGGVAAWSAYLAYKGQTVPLEQVLYRKRLETIEETYVLIEKLNSKVAERRSMREKLLPLSPRLQLEEALINEDELPPLVDRLEPADGGRKFNVGQRRSAGKHLVPRAQVWEARRSYWGPKIAEAEDEIRKLSRKLDYQLTRIELYLSGDILEPIGNLLNIVIHRLEENSLRPPRDKEQQEKPSKYVESFRKRASENLESPGLGRSLEERL